mmetsp:Transcript_22477/g.36133  ORF Transcript_22477/g.36133 Transcript_22477/m.36133 type:complete len:187 (-) Transcript_22477:25-585(-)
MTPGHKPTGEGEPPGFLPKIRPAATRINSKGDKSPPPLSVKQVDTSTKTDPGKMTSRLFGLHLVALCKLRGGDLDNAEIDNKMTLSGAHKSPDKHSNNSAQALLLNEADKLKQAARFRGIKGSMLTDRASIASKKALQRYHQRKAIRRVGDDPNVVTRKAALASAELASRNPVTSLWKYSKRFAGT